jgi:plastocyanin
MNRRGLVVLASLFALVFVVTVIMGCGGGSKSTSPPAGPSFDLRFPATGASQTFTFTTAGTWAYHCTPHQGAGMTGTVTVDAGAPSDSALVNVSNGSSTLQFFPSAVSIKPNGHVRWVNASPMTNHTVTRP